MIKLQKTKKTKEKVDVWGGGEREGRGRGEESRKINSCIEVYNGLSCFPSPTASHFCLLPLPALQDNPPLLVCLIAPQCS